MASFRWRYSDLADDRTSVVFWVPMHPDRKIGIAMGILLVGVVAALFFRNEPLDTDRSLSADREDELNERLRERDVSVYLDTDREQSVSEEEDPKWTLSEILRARRPQPPPQPIAQNAAVAPEPDAALPEEPAMTFTPPEIRAVRRAAVLQRQNRQPNPAQPSRGEPSMADVIDGRAPPEMAALRKRPAGDGYEEYEVQYGDTLSGISKRFLGSHSRYRDIYDANKDRIDNPDRLKVGTAIRIPRSYH